MSYTISLPRKIIAPGDFKLYKSLGPLIKDYRQWRQLTQETLAESVGMSVRELQYWEKNRHCAHIGNLHDFSENTGIPMQVCIALNADLPIWYSMKKRWFAYSSMEIAQFRISDLVKFPEQFDNGILLKTERISTDRHITMVLSCHREIYRAEKSLRRDVIKTAIMILPDLNRIFFDSWGHYMGHIICLPIKKDVYQKLKKQKSFEDYLTTEKISDIVPLHEGVFFYYSSFTACFNVAHQIVIDDARYFAKIEQKENYIVACYSALEAKEFLSNFGIKLSKDYQQINDAGFPAMYEIKLDVLMTPLGPWGWVMKEYNKRKGWESRWRGKREGWSAIPAQKPQDIIGPFNKYSTGKMLGNGLSVDDVLSVDKKGQEDQTETEAQIYQLKAEACPNPKCPLYGKPGKGNIVSNGTYRMKEGALSRRFFCKECGESFCSRAGSIFYGLRSPEEKILKALKLFTKGIPLQSIAKILGVELRTVQRWLKVVAEQRGKIDAMLIKKLKVSQVELDALWTFSKETPQSNWKVIGMC